MRPHHRIVWVGLMLVAMFDFGFALEVADRLPLGHPDFVPTPARPVGWRGDGTGIYPGATPVADWDLTSKRNVVWQTRMPFFSAAGPIVVGDRVFTTGEPDLLICVDARTGKELWRQHCAVFMEKLPQTERDRLYGNCEKLLNAGDAWMRWPVDDLHQNEMKSFWYDGRVDRRYGADHDEAIRKMAVERKVDLDSLRTMFAEVGRTGQKNQPPLKTPDQKGLLGDQDYIWYGNCAATPASDGANVVVQVGTHHSPTGWGYLLCFDIEGRRKWATEVGQNGNWAANFSSPLIVQGKVICANRRTRGQDRNGKMIDNADGVGAYDLATGAQVWSVPAAQSCSSPIAFAIDGVQLVHYASMIMLPADGSIVCDLRGYFGADVDTPVVDGDRFLGRGAEGKHFEANKDAQGRSCCSAVLKLTWKTKGRELVFETLWKAPREDRFFLSSNWHRSSPLLTGSWILCARGAPVPNLFRYDFREDPVPGQPFSRYEVKLDKAQAVRDPKGRQYGPPAEDLISVSLAGRLIFSGTSVFPTQFLVSSAPPEFKIAGAPVLDCWAVGAPFFQGGRMYVRDYRYLYCLLSIHI
jgi:outer membrane protein assembly factor BamB